MKNFEDIKENYLHYLKDLTVGYKRDYEAYKEQGNISAVAEVENNLASISNKIENIDYFTKKHIEQKAKELLDLISKNIETYEGKKNYDEGISVYLKNVIGMTKNETGELVSVENFEHQTGIAVSIQSLIQDLGLSLQELQIISCRDPKTEAYDDFIQMINSKYGTDIQMSNSVTEEIGRGR